MRKTIDASMREARHVRHTITEKLCSRQDDDSTLETARVCSGTLRRRPGEIRERGREHRLSERDVTTELVLPPYHSLHTNRHKITRTYGTTFFMFPPNNCFTAVNKMWSVLLLVCNHAKVVTTPQDGMGYHHTLHMISRR